MVQSKSELIIFLIKFKKLGNNPSNLWKFNIKNINMEEILKHLYKDEL